MTQEEEQRIREAGKKMDPTELERVISRMKAKRRKAASYRSHPDQVKQELMAAVDQMRQADAQSNPEKFRDARSQLDRQLSWLSQNRVALSPEIGNELVEALLSIYEKRAATSAPPDHLPIMVAAKYGSSPRVKNYLTKIIHGPVGPERERALLSLAGTTNLKGDAEMFSLLSAELQRKEQDNDILILGVMSRVDKDKALPLVLHEIDTTSNIRRFTRISDTLSQYGRPDLLDHVLQRVANFPRKSWGDLENPTLGIYPDILLRYISDSEDEKLELGLKALDQHVTALMKCPPVLLNKLDKGTPRSRRAVAKFLEKTAGLEPFKKPDVTQALQDRANKESDPDTKQALNAAVDRIRKKDGGHE